MIEARTCEPVRTYFWKGSQAIMLFNNNHLEQFARTCEPSPTVDIFFILLINIFWGGKRGSQGSHNDINLYLIILYLMRTSKMGFARFAGFPAKGKSWIAEINPMALMGKVQAK
jgi:hypothetical protein